MLTTAEAAARIGVSKNTLLRWLAEGRLADVARDWRNWRVWSEGDVARARELRERLHAQGAEEVLAVSVAPAPATLPAAAKPLGSPEYAQELVRLGRGREYRHQVAPAPRPKTQMPLYAREMSRLDHGRAWRREEEPSDAD